MNDLSVPPDPESAVQVDYLSRDRLTTLQVERLQRVVQLAYDQIELLRARLTDSGVLPQQIVGLDDLSRLPFTVKQDLRDTYPYGMLACPMAEVSRIHASSGTTGTPIVVPYTDRDLKVWTSAMVRTLNAYGIHARDVIQNAYGYGLFTGGLGVHYGGEQLGATMVPICRAVPIARFSF